MKSFADIPAEVRRRVDAGERVIVILFDAFGWSSSSAITITRLIQRLEVTPLTSQFPSTMTAHVPSVRFGMPVHEHGLYEWIISSGIGPRLKARLGDVAVVDAVGRDSRPSQRPK